jgi:hypothetical protein
LREIEQQKARRFNCSILNSEATPPRIDRRREPTEPSESWNLQQPKEANRTKEAPGEVTGDQTYAKDQSNICSFRMDMEIQMHA